MSLDTSRALYKKGAGMQISTDADQFGVPRAFDAWHYIAPADAAAESDTSVMALTELGAQAKSVLTGFTSPAVPRNVKVDGSAANMTGNVKVYGTNFAGDAINETIALDGTTAKAGDLAFKTITKVDLPARTNTPAKQKATIAVTGGAQGDGTTVFTFTSGATGAPYDISVDFASTDNAEAEAAEVLAVALNGDEDFAEYWLAESSEANVTIESLTTAAQDDTINLVVTTAGTSAVTLGSIDADTVPGVAPDKVSVGIGKKFGIPYLLPTSDFVDIKLFNNAADTGTVTADIDKLENNVIALNGTPDGANSILLHVIVPPIEIIV